MFVASRTLSTKSPNNHSPMNRLFGFGRSSVRKSIRRLHKRAFGVDKFGDIEKTLFEKLEAADKGASIVNFSVRILGLTRAETEHLLDQIRG